MGNEKMIPFPEEQYQSCILRTARDMSLSHSQLLMVLFTKSQEQVVAIYNDFEKILRAHDLIKGDMIMALCEALSDTISAATNKLCVKPIRDELRNGCEMSEHINMRYNICDPLKQGLEQCSEAHKQDLVGYVKQKQLFAHYAGSNGSATSSPAGDNTHVSIRAKTMILLFFMILGFTIKLSILIHHRYTRKTADRGGNIEGGMRSIGGCGAQSPS
ncbi:MAG: hypothetical protein Q9168_003550 [Polycauliona sp. 1 TL-2023]